MIEYVLWLRLCGIRPTWAWQWFKQWLESPKRFFSQAPQRTEEYLRYLCPMEEALAKATDQSIDAVKLTFTANRDQLPVEKRNDSRVPSTIDASPELAQLCYAIVRLLKPKTVVETGVGRGFTTSHILKALHDNGHGQLYSIELPLLSIGAERSIGCLVPESVKSRWTLMLGPSLRLLPRLLPKLSSCDVFIHDSDHGYNNQLGEYRLAWRYLPSGGVLVSDDVWNDAFLAAADAFHVHPIIVRQSKSESLIGVLIKP